MICFSEEKKFYAKSNARRNAPLRIGHFCELLGYKDLIFMLAWGDFKLRYKSSALGFFWSLITWNFLDRGTSICIYI